MNEYSEENIIDVSACVPVPLEDFADLIAARTERDIILVAAEIYEYGYHLDEIIKVISTFHSKESADGSPDDPTGSEGDNDA